MQIKTIIGTFRDECYNTWYKSVLVWFSEFNICFHFGMPALFYYGRSPLRIIQTQYSNTVITGEYIMIGSMFLYTIVQ